MSWTRRHKAWARHEYDLSSARWKREHARCVMAKAVWISSLLTGLQPHVILGDGKEQDVAWARLVAMKLTHAYADIGWSPVADVFAVDRTAIRNAVRRIDDLCDKNAAVADVWRDAHRFMDMEIRHAENVGVLRSQRERYQDDADRVRKGDENWLQRVRPSNLAQPDEEPV